MYYICPGLVSRQIKIKQLKKIMVTNGLVCNQAIQVDRFDGKNNYVLNKQKPQT